MLCCLALAAVQQMDGLCRSAAMSVCSVSGDVEAQKWAVDHVKSFTRLQRARRTEQVNGTAGVQRAIPRSNRRSHHEPRIN